MVVVLVMVKVMTMVMMAVMMKMTMKKIRMRKTPARDFSLAGLVKMSAQRTRDWAAVCKNTVTITIIIVTIIVISIAIALTITIIININISTKHNDYDKPDLKHWLPLVWTPGPHWDPPLGVHEVHLMMMIVMRVVMIMMMIIFLWQWRNMIIMMMMVMIFWFTQSDAIHVRSRWGWRDIGVFPDQCNHQWSPSSR